MADPLKILHAVSADGKWETSVHVATLAAALREHDVTSVVTAPDHSRLWELAEAGGVEAAEVSLENSINPLRWLEIGKTIKAIEPHVIHVHDAEAAKLLGRASMLSTLTKIAVSRQESTPAPSGSEYGGSVGAVICPSERMAETFRQAAADSDKVHVVYNGVNIAAAERASQDRDALRAQYRDAYCPDKEKPLFLVNIAPLEEASGQTELLEAMSEAVAALPQCHLFIMGEGAMADDLKRQIKITALINDVTILEPDKAFYRLLGAADVYVTNSADDVSGYMVQIAMAAGRAVAAPKAGCYEELIEDGKTGVFATEEEGASSLKNAIMTLLESRTKREHIGRLAKAKAAKRFDASEQAGKVAEIYRALS